MMTKIPKTPIKRYKTLSRPEIFEKFARWMAFPPSLRSPRHQKDFAKLYEVSPDTLSDYKKLGHFWDTVEQNKDKIRSEIVDAKAFLAIYGDQSKREDLPESLSY